ncbi:Hypothetical_protein [Hexamita inflata]|uniref:Hypothetical_protein n=1 Tax=Hexamita inflata TaxID=28002 RepID=A0AA86PRW2_9EUKA|nr:Hypothetical protein HINF_LOCUS27547 [Hexamita inflata]
MICNIYNLRYRYALVQWCKITSSPPGLFLSASKNNERNNYFPDSQFYLQTVKINLRSSKCLTSLRVRIRECAYELYSIHQVYLKYAKKLNLTRFTIYTFKNSQRILLQNKAAMNITYCHFKYFALKPRCLGENQIKSEFTEFYSIFTISLVYSYLSNIRAL